MSGILNKLSARTATIKAFDKKLKTLKKVLDNVKRLWQNDECSAEAGVYLVN